jgi:hypothetical protein
MQNANRLKAIALAALLLVLSLAAYSLSAEPDYQYQLALRLKIEQAGSTSPALPAPVTPAKHDDTASVQEPTPPVPVVIKAAPKWPAYPNRSVSGSHWQYNGGQITAAHLADPRGHHAHEHFNRTWLNTLSQSQLTALGSDAHEGRVREAYVVRGTSVKAAGHWETRKFCTSRGCTYRRVWIAD